MTKTYEIAYHFVGEKLRGGLDVPEDGVKLVHDGDLKLCRSGLHASLHPFDALKYAPEYTLCKVLCEGEIIHRDDKLVCSERTILARFDATSLLQEFAHDCALDVVHLWDAPDVVVEFLKTGDKKLRKTTEDASAAVYAASYAAASRAASRAAVYAASRAAASRTAYHAAYHAAYAAANATSNIEKYKEKFASLVEAEFEKQGK